MSKDELHGELREYHEKILGIPLIRRAKRVGCGQNPDKCPFIVRPRLGQPLCHLTPPNSIEINNLVINTRGELTAWRPAEIDCGEEESLAKNSGSKEDPLLRKLIKYFPGLITDYQRLTSYFNLLFPHPLSQDFRNCN